MNRDFELKMSTAKIFRIVSVLIGGIFTGNYSFKNVMALINSVIISENCESIMKNMHIKSSA